MGYHDPPPRSPCYLACLNSLSQTSYLVHLQKQRIAHLLLNPRSDPLGVCHKQVIPHDLGMSPQSFLHLGVSCEIILVEGVFDGDDGEILDEVFVEVDEFSCGEETVLGACFPGEVVLFEVCVVEFGGGAVQADSDCVFVAGFLDCFSDKLKTVSLILDLRTPKSPFIAHISRSKPVFLLYQLLQCMVHLASNPHRLSESRCPCWKDHELLHGQLITRMSPSIDDIEGRHREDELLCSSACKVCNVLVEWDLLGEGCCSSDG